MAEKTVKTRIVHKHETEANWNQAENFKPKKGELIIYDPDSSYDYPRVKIGDGETVVKDLPFITSDISWAPSEGLSFKLSSDESYYEVAGIGTCTDTDIIIPARHKSKAVKAINASAFYANVSITSIVIPNSVTSISSNAFKGCTSLTDIKIPNSVTTIGVGAFQSCNSLTSIQLPNRLATISGQTFINCSTLKSVTIPKSVTKISGQAFAFCQALTDIYYTGSEADWGSITITSNGNDLLNTVAKHFNFAGDFISIDDKINQQVANIQTQLDDKLDLAGGELSGEISVNGKASIDTNGYVIGTWLQMTADTALGSTPTQGICVKQNGWIYTRTLDQVRNDIGAAPIDHAHDSETWTFVLADGKKVTKNVAAATVSEEAQS